MLEETRTQEAEGIHREETLEQDPAELTEKLAPQAATRRKRPQVATQTEFRVVIWPNKPAEIIDEGGPHSPRLAEVQAAMKADSRIRVIRGAFEEPVLKFKSELEGR